ncbi:hypothetical protein OSB04_032258 [Centaurea solstitialis]|uniref:TTF-type domain-containing protein n=1 Tax=Centaurea solstitialis TaxID=347529 RepID=A0AA38W5J6_9ASTR|nr:hypothetical protein OSB04_032258 [Centaurea solstitialis]
MYVKGETKALKSEIENTNSRDLQITVLKFFKKVGESSSSDIPKTTNVEETFVKDYEQETPLKYMKIDLDSLPADPGQRPSMEVYHVNQRDEIRRHYLQKGPCQPRNHFFERREIGGRVRKFNPSWFDDHKYWLEYNIELEAAFCLCCYLFKTDLKNQGGVDNFMKGELKAWNKKERLDFHSNGGSHNLAVQKCQNLMKQGQSIATIFDKQTDSKKDKNRTKIYASIDCLRFLLRQGLSFRGHNEGGDSRNKGNFLELLHFYAERNDKVGNVVVKNAPRNSQMKSSSIQKDIVRACAIETLKVIRKEIEDSFFSILVDESRDVSCKEQMALVLWFVNDKGLVVERFIGIKHVDDTSSLSLKATIYSVLSEHDWHFFVAKNHQDINDFFELTSRLLNMIGSSYKRRDKLRDKQATRVVAALADGDLESGTGLNQEIGIKRPSDTRWGSHYGSLLNIKALYPSICEVLEDIMEDANSQDHRSEARLRASKERLQETRNEGWQPLLSNITSFCNKYDVENLNMEHPYYNGISRRKGSKVSNSRHYQVDVFYSVIDMQLQELNNRFNEANTMLLLSISSLCPRQSFKAFQVDELMKMAQFYPVEFPSTELEALRCNIPFRNPNLK